MKNKIWVIILLISILISACDKPVRATIPPGPDQTWIDAPLDGSTLPLAPYTVIFHGASFVGVTEFEVRVDGVVLAITIPISGGSGGANYGTLFLSEYEWNPTVPGTYMISVRAKGNGVYSPPAQVQVTITGGKQIDLPAEVPQDSMVEAGECMFTAAINLFCRLSSGSLYLAVDNFVAGQSAPIVGQSTDGFFWYVYGPNYGELCTVPKAEKFGEADGDCDEQPRYTPMPLPSPTPTLEPTPCPAGIPCPP